jgi:phosphoribosyl 1,2-cyclic phosphodiesterase
MGPRKRPAHRFGYAFVQPEGSAYPAILDLHAIDGDITIEGAGGAITFRPFEVTHGSIDALGFRIGDLAYLPDVSDIPEGAWPMLEDLDCWVLDALAPHAASVPCASGEIAGVDRTRGPPAGRSDEHAYRSGLPHGGGRNPRPYRARP